MDAANSIRPTYQEYSLIRASPTRNSSWRALPHKSKPGMANRPWTDAPLRRPTSGCRRPPVAWA